jgi:hypothetical protein
MLQLLLLYVIIIIFQALYIHYFPSYDNNPKIKILKEKIKFNIENEKEIDKIIRKKIQDYADLINNNTMSYDDWCTFLRKNNAVKIGDYDYTLACLQSVPNSDEIISIVAAKSEELKGNLDISLYSEIVKLKAANQIDGVNTLETVHPKVMIKTSRLNEVFYLTYRWVDPDTNENVIRKTFYTKWKTKEGESGIIMIGYNVENINFIKRYRYIDLIYKPELCLTSILLFILSVVIFRIKSYEYVKVKSVAFLVLSNIYLLFFINRSEYYSTITTEVARNAEINSSILDVSFLSSVNIFIMNFIYSKHNSLFVETAAIFGVSIILLLTAIYKSTTKNNFAEIVGARITNQLVFNMSIFLNAAIIFNFLYYSVFINKKK